MHLKYLSPALLVVSAWLLPASPAVADVATPPAGSAEEAPKPQDSTQMAGRVDELVQQMWTAENVQPAPEASDGEFLRRAYLDLNGVIPRAAEVRAFMADDRPDKRVRLVDQLLTSPRYATHMATIWRNRILPVNADAARATQAVALQKWLRTRFAKNLRYDNLVGELLLTIGGDELGPALYFQAQDLSPEKLAASSAELFLGVQLHCAQCHDHPTAAWTQRDFWGLAAFFARVKAPPDPGMRMSYRLIDADQGEVQLPESNEVVPPKFPGGDVATDEERRSRRVQLALWLTSNDNDFFARAAVNWAWSHMFGQGLVESLDNVSDTSNEAQLMNELAKYFVRSGYNLRELWRTLALTRAYQLSSRDTESTVPAQHFARMLAKPLTPEQLYDSFTILAPATDTIQTPDVTQPSNGPKGLDENPIRVEFIRRMRPPPGSAIEYRAGTLQALMMMNGRTMADLTTAGESSLLGALDAPFMSDGDRVDSLFLATLARRPDADEAAACLATLQDCHDAPERNRALSDILWAVLNSTEFAFNQ